MAESTFQKALISWRDIDLGSLQKRLKTQCREVKQGEESSLLERKSLAQAAKDFRKLGDEDKLAQWRQLLKNFQNGIDSLTNRAKLAETYFLSLEDSIGSAPDPYPLLEATIDQLYSSEDAARLDRENRELRARIAEQDDIDALREKLAQLESRTEARIRDAEQAKESELMALMSEKSRNWESREQELQSQLASARESYKDLKANSIIAQESLNKSATSASVTGAAQIAELDILQTDLQRVRTQTAELEQRNGELVQEIAALKSGQGSKYDLRITELETQLESLEADHNSLGRKFSNTRDSHQAEVAALLRRQRELEAQVARRSDDLRDLQRKLAQYSDYGELKKELAMLRRIEFSLGDDEDDGGQGENSIEQMMRAHNRKLNDDMTVLRNELSECRGQLERSTEVNTSLTAKISELEQANERLENDLMEMNDHTEARSVAPSRFTRAPSTAWGRISPTTSIIGTRAGADAAAENEVNASILPIITQQRDRFKARNTELEGDLKALQAKVQQLQSETQTLQKDNVALYERNRYLASYRTEGQTTGRDTVINMSGSSGGTKQSGLMDRYASKYEESVSPFESFRQRESTRAVQSLDPIEKVIYQIARFVLASKLRRILFTLYLTALHILYIYQIW